MNNKKESAVSPVIAVVLILALVVVIATMVSFSVISNVDNILINNVKDVDVTIKISGNNMSVYMVAGKDLALLEDYTLYRLGDKEFDPLVHSINATKYPINASEYPGSINDNISYINILGDFVDGEKVVIFTGKIVDGYVVQTNVVEDDRLFWVKYDDNGGSGDVPEDNHEYKPGSEVTVKFTPVPTNVDGNKFDGWKDSSGTLYTVTGTNKFHIYENTTLYANYTKEYTVKYYDNKTLNGGELIETKIYSPGETVTVKESITRLPDILFTYTFTNWTTEYNGVRVEYSPGSTITINSDLNLYAKWSYIPIIRSYSVTYDINLIGGEGGFIDPNGPYTPNSMVDVLPLDIGKQTQTIGEITYYFVSWNTEQDGTGKSYYPPDTFKITESTTLYAVWTTQDPYFRHGTYKSGTTDNYDTLGELLDAINKWKPGTIDYSGGDTITATIKKDIPLAEEPITLNSGWELTLNVDGDIEKTDDGNIYPSTNPAIWAAPVHNEIKSLIVLDNPENDEPTQLTLVSDLVLDGNYRMQESIIKVSRNSELNVGNNDLTIVNGIRGNRAITTDGGGIYNSGNVTTDGGEIRIDNCWALNGGGFYNYGSNTINDPYANASVKLNITNCRADFVKDSKPQGAGGGIYSYYSTTVLKSGSVIDNCYATENGGGIFAFDPQSFVILDGSKIINNRAESPDKGNGGGIFLHYGDLKIYNSIITGNTASGNGGGIYNYYTSYGSGTVNLHYDASLIDNSIYNNTAIEGGGIYNYAGSYIKYNGNDPRKLGENNNAYDWFRNIHLVNDAVTHKNYNLLDNPKKYYYTEGKSYGNTVSELKDSINKWSKLVYGFNLVSSNGNELIPISDYPIIISGDPIEINMDMKITGSETLYLISAPVYDGVLLKINNTKKLTSSSDVIIDGNGINRNNPLVNIGENSELNINGGDFAVRYGYGKGISNANTNGVIKIESGSLTVKGNKVTSSGGGIHNKGTIDVNSEGTLNVKSNTAATNGGGIYNEGGTITVDGTLTVRENTANFGGGIYTDFKKIDDDFYGAITVNSGGTLNVQSNTVTITGGGIYNNYGVINVGGTLTVSENTATTNGGGIYNLGRTITVISEGILNVQSNNARYGGGIYNNIGSINSVNYYGTINVDGTLNVQSNAVTDGNGGGIYNNNKNGKIDVDGTLNVQSNIVTNGNGGGIYNIGTIAVNSGGTLTALSNKATTNANVISTGGGIYNAGGYITNSDSNQIILEDNEAINGGGICSTTTGSSDNYYKINVTAKGNKAINLPVITNNANGIGGGIYNTGNYVTINGDILGNTAINNGGGIYNKGDNVKINVNVYGNRANYGGGIQTGSVSEVSGIISGNTANITGGGIYNSGTMNVTDEAYVQDNTAKNGGGIYIHDRGTMNVNGGSLTVSGNTATGIGGGIYIYRYSYPTIININFGGSLTVSGNTATMNGGGIYSSYGNITIFDNAKLDVLDNYAESYGGGIYLSGYQHYSGAYRGIMTVNPDGLLNVSGNTANAKNGGGIYNSGGKIYDNGISKVQSNTARENGGGIYNSDGNGVGEVFLNYDEEGDNSLINSIYNNTAKYGGGIWSSSKNKVFYGGIPVSSLPDGNIKGWFDNDLLRSSYPNSATDESKNYK